MITPAFQDFIALAASHTLVPVAKTISADLLTPVSAFLAIAKNEPHAFLLESVEGGEKVGRYTFLGVRPYMIVRSKDDRIEVRDAKGKEKSKGNIFTKVRELLAEHRSAIVSGMPPFTSGAVGYFAYDAARQLEKLPNIAKDDLKLPDCLLMFFDRVLAFDHVRQQVHIIATANIAAQSPKDAYAGALRAIERLEKLLSHPPKAAASRRKAASTKIKRSTEEKRFLTSVLKIKDYISAGDVFQAVLSQRMEMQSTANSLDVYRALRRVNPSPYMYYLRMDKLEVLGSSPEMLVKVKAGRSGSTLQYRPIAGTRWRSADEAEDKQLAEELRSDEKERAEHVMLVDLGRNDLGRVSEFGSVQVTDFMFVERYSHVMHLVSALESTLRKGLQPIDAFASCFPAGTLTGAPKVRAMEIIEELEPVRRGVYGGAILYADFAGNLDSCIAIRTMVVKDNKAYVQAGAGIVADSVPQREHEECLNKGKALVKAIETA